jgi:hypothetical protein
VIDQSQDSLLDEDAVKESLLFSIFGDASPATLDLAASGRSSRATPDRQTMDERFSVIHDAELYISQVVAQRASLLEAESRQIAEDTLSVYCPYLVRRAFLTVEEKRIEDTTAAYTTFVDEVKAQHSSERAPSAEPTSARRANFIQNVAEGDQHVAVEKAVDAYMGYLTGLKQVAAREEAAVTKSLETYCPILIRHSQMDPESRKVSDAASLYTRYLVQTPAERAAAAAESYKGDGAAAAVYANALVLRASQREAKKARKTAGRDARTYLAELLPLAASPDVWAASVSAIVYSEVLWPCNSLLEFQISCRF